MQFDDDMICYGMVYLSTAIELKPGGKDDKMIRKKPMQGDEERMFSVFIHFC